MSPALIHTPSRVQGFTLIELLVVMAIMLILLALSIEGFLAFNRQPRSAAVAHTIAGAVREAHARSISADTDQSYGVHIATTSVTIFEGTSYVISASTNEVRTFYRGEVSDLSLSGGVDNIVFSRLRGVASATGTVTVIDVTDTTNTHIVTIHETGLAEVQ